MLFTLKKVLKMNRRVAVPAATPVAGLAMADQARSAKCTMWFALTVA